MRNPPQDIEGEMMILGGILLDPGSFEKASGLVTTQDFYGLLLKRGGYGT